MGPALRLQPGQQALTPAQEAEARRFAEASIQAQLATDPVDERVVEQLLRQVYAVAGLPPPRRIRWVDGPMHLIAAQLRHRVTREESVWDKVGASLQQRLWESTAGTSLRPGVGELVGASVWEGVRERVREGVGVTVGARVEASVWDSVRATVEASLWSSIAVSVEASVWAYVEASSLAFAHFFDRYLASNALHALAQFNERVSGYWLGKEAAVVVRRPRLLSRDAAGRLHSATGKCLEYQDGWGFYAWHGVRVPEQVILAAERLAGADFLNERNVGVRRVIQERMGDRFVPELGGVVLDTEPRGTLYEVALPNDPERVARYVEVHDSSTPRRYFLRVPPTIQTAAEAVAWSFGLSVEEYGPAQET